MRETDFSSTALQGKTITIPPQDRDVIYSIGYATRTRADFIRQLQAQGITTLADVRSMPGSSAFPEFNREALARALAKEGIEYVWMGESLGPRSRHPEHYDATGQVQFDKLRATPLFQQGLKQLMGIDQTQSVVCMCAEKYPETCHRSLLIGEALFDRQVTMTHIHFDGRLETHQQLRGRAAEAQGGLFADEDLAMQELIKQHAYRRPATKEATRSRPVRTPAPF